MAQLWRFMSTRPKWHPENVRYWHLADMPKNAIDVAFGGKADIT
jgi:hypothetical protein